VKARLQILAVQGAQMPLAFKRITRGLVKMPLAAYVRLVDPTHNILYVNRAFTKLLGYEPDEIVGYPACCVFSDDAKEELCVIVGAAEGGANLDEKPSRFKAKNGRVLSVILTRQLFDIDGRIHDETGNPAVWAVIYIQDITRERNHTAILESFVATVNHEVRTPLNAIIGFSDALLSGMAGPMSQQAREYLNIIRESGVLMQDLVARELHCTKFEHYEIQERRLVVGSMVQFVCHIVTHHTLESGVRLQYETTDEVLLYADPVAVQLMIAQLVKNAVRYNRVGGEVRLSYAVIDGEVVVTVSDTGIGIAPEHIANIFDLHFRVNHRIQGGQGLGLALVKRFIEKHDGTVSVESELGKGSIFTLRFPKERTMYRN